MLHEQWPPSGSGDLVVQNHHNETPLSFFLKNQMPITHMYSDERGNQAEFNKCGGHSKKKWVAFKVCEIPRADSRDIARKRAVAPFYPTVLR